MWKLETYFCLKTNRQNKNSIDSDGRNKPQVFNLGYRVTVPQLVSALTVCQGVCEGTDVCVCVRKEESVCVCMCEGRDVYVCMTEKAGACVLR